MKKSKAAKDHKKKKSHRDSLRWHELNKLKQYPPQKPLDETKK